MKMEKPLKLKLQWFKDFCGVSTFERFYFVFIVQKVGKGKCLESAMIDVSDPHNDDSRIALFHNFLSLIFFSLFIHFPKKNSPICISGHFGWSARESENKIISISSFLEKKILRNGKKWPCLYQPSRKLDLHLRHKKYIAARLELCLSVSRKQCQTFFSLHSEFSIPLLSKGEAAAPPIEEKTIDLSRTETGPKMWLYKKIF